MTGVLHRVRLATRRFGIDVGRWRPVLDPMQMLGRLLVSRGITTVVDVGANVGDYGGELRDAGFTGRIISYEPLPGPFDELSRRTAPDPHWDVYRYAVGDTSGMVTINIAANTGASSSILPMLQAHSDAHPAANYVGTCQAEIRCLDELVLPLLGDNDRVFVKADVQGFERAVIDGATHLLARAAGMQLELSFVPLYEGGMLYREALDLTESLGFVVMGMIPGFTDPRDGRLLQADGIFMREN